MTTRSVQPWFRRFRQLTESPRLRLVGLPHAGGAASLFRTWTQKLPVDLDFLAVCYPGRQDRINEPCVDRLELLADEVTEALLPWLDVPLALFGHSMGGSIAHEVAVQLSTRGTPPVALFVSGRLPPHRLRARTLARHGDDAIIADVLRLGGATRDLLSDPELRAMVLPALRADYQIVEDYRPAAHPRLNIPVTAYLGVDDPETNLAEMAEWSTVTTGPCQYVEFDGGHFYLTEHEDDLVKDVLNRLTGH